MLNRALSQSNKVYVIVPTLNAAKDWRSFLAALLSCGIRPDHVFIVDSESTDGTAELARAAGFEVLSIRRVDFDHGGTRQVAAEKLDHAEILVYLTQDAVMANSQALQLLLAAFDDPLVGAAYGRQLPRPGAEAIEIHARNFNYPQTSEVRSLTSRDRIGIKAAFLSNSFAAYRRSTLLKVGGFPRNALFGEDTITAAKILLEGHKIAYVAEACVYHSHAYTCAQEFRRYFDIGVLHSRERWLIDAFGKATGEGKRFVVSQLKYLRGTDSWQIPSALVRAGIKLLGYRLGQMEARLTPNAKRRLSMHPEFWNNNSGKHAR
jgi:rhamnosyltransferase